MHYSKILKFLFFCLLTPNLFAGYSDFATSFASQPEKLKSWQKMAEEIDHTVDGAGYPIDKKIKEVVIVLNLLGFRTTASCEGHLDHGDCYPWIDIGMEQAIPEHLQQELEAVAEQMQQVKLPISDEDIKSAKIVKRFDALKIQKEKYILQQTSSVHQLLEGFYATSNALFYTVQIGEKHLPWGEVRIYSKDGDWQLIRSENKKKLKLLEYQKEMDRFTNFLIGKFLYPNSF